MFKIKYRDRAGRVVREAVDAREPITREGIVYASNGCGHSAQPLDERAMVWTYVRA
jgi:hypothetical protein